MSTQYDIWYNKEGERWFEGLPLGNGRLGAMVYGGLTTESIDLSESTCYSGQVEETNNPESKEYYPLAKEAMFKRDYKAAVEYATHMTGSRANYGTNLPLGNIQFAFDHNKDEIENYVRGLTFQDGLASASYDYQGIHFTREFFCTNVDQVIGMKFSADTKGAITFKATFHGGENPHQVLSEGTDLILKGQSIEPKHTVDDCGVDYIERATFLPTGGTITATDGITTITGADEVIVYIAIHTDYLNKFPTTSTSCNCTTGSCGCASDEDCCNGTHHQKACPEQECILTLTKICGKSYPQVLAQHIEDFSSFMARVDFQLDGADYGKLPTDERLINFKNGTEDDFNLFTTMFQYARYLLLSSSRENSPLPTHLQGVWNDNVACRIGWTCDMHLDINTQMNYWPAQTTNLSECTKPLFDWLYYNLLPSGQHSARMSYDCDGFVAHTVSNPWGFTAPGAAVYWGFHMTGGAWITTHMWEHYKYTLDKDFLTNMAYPMMKENCKFFVDYLEIDPQTGYYVTPLSHSPENNYFIDEVRYSIALMPTCDIAILTELFETTIEAAKTLGVDTDFAEKLQEIKANFPPYQITSDGRLQEWMEEYKEAQPNHRHTTQLLGLYPFHSITPELTPELAQAAKKSIQGRLTPYSNWEDTGWARSMLMCYSARLWDEEASYFHVTEMMKRITETNLFVIHPPTAGATSNVYELDGNTGLCACMAEMLLQSYDDTLHLLPALPKEWKDGHIKGLKARNSLTVDIYFNNNQITKAIIQGTPEQELRIKHKEQVLVKNIPATGTLELTF